MDVKRDLFWEKLPSTAIMMGRGGEARSAVSSVSRELAGAKHDGQMAAISCRVVRARAALVRFVA